MSYQHKKATLTEPMRQYMLARSAQVTPDNPSQQGWSAPKIRQYQWKPSDILFTYMSGVETNLIDYVNECIDTISTNAGEITKLWEEVGKKQNKLIAGKGILIQDDVITAIGEQMDIGPGLSSKDNILQVDYTKVQRPLHSHNIMMSLYKNERYAGLITFKFEDTSDKEFDLSKWQESFPREKYEGKTIHVSGIYNDDGETSGMSVILAITFLRSTYDESDFMSVSVSLNFSAYSLKDLADTIQITDSVI